MLSSARMAASSALGHKPLLIWSVGDWHLQKTWRAVKPRWCMARWLSCLKPGVLAFRPPRQLMQLRDGGPDQKMAT